jgi:hypothetical protein
MLGWGAQHKSILLCFGEAGECVWFTANSSPIGAPQVTRCLFTSRAVRGRAGWLVPLASASSFSWRTAAKPVLPHREDHRADCDYGRWIGWRNAGKSVAQAWLRCSLGHTQSCRSEICEPTEGPGSTASAGSLSGHRGHCNALVQHGGGCEKPGE